MTGSTRVSGRRTRMLVASAYTYGLSGADGYRVHKKVDSRLTPYSRAFERVL